MGKFIDLTGMKFGRLTVIGLDKEKTEEMRRLKKYGTFWICQCECENKTIKTINGSSLNRGLTISCGCYNKEEINKRSFKNLTEKRFGRLVVLGLDEEKNKTITDGSYSKYYKCLCDCGNEKSIESSCLKSGKTQSCGCLKSEVLRDRNFKNLTGKVFGRLKVLKLDEERNKNSKATYWLCECKCGNDASVNSASLLSGKTISCGCYHKEKSREINFKDLTGQTFGRWKVLYYDEEKSTHGKNGKSMWFCECECGNTSSVESSRLLNGTSKSCGCFKKEMSSRENNPNWRGGATEIKHYLRNHLTEWKKESLKHASYKCCVTGKNGKFNIHHTYPFQYIFYETMDELNIPIYEKIGEYTEEELDKILKLLLEKHFYYGYGAVVLEDVHLEFHNIYGRGGCGMVPPGEKEWEEFKNTYKITNN